MPFPSPVSRKISRSSSVSSQSDDGSQPDSNHSNKTLEPAILVYHESARSIVFRDHLRRAVQRKDSDAEASALGLQRKGSTSSVPEFPDRKQTIVLDDDRKVNKLETMATLASEILDTSDTVAPSEAGIPPSQIAGFQPKIQPLPSLDLGPEDQFEPLINAPSGHDAFFPAEWNAAEREVVQMFKDQKCVVKTIKNVDWTSFLRRFQYPEKPRGRSPQEHDDRPPDALHPFNSFVTSTTLLPSLGEKMRCYGSPVSYTTGVVFALPDQLDGETEDDAAERTSTWAWPAGYSAKTEFNIDGRGQLINGRKEALKPLSVLREYNNDYVNKDEYMVSLRLVSGLKQIPYNEVFIRVGGLGRIVQGMDCITDDIAVARRSFDKGVGLPVALFVRTATYGHLISLLRTRARLAHVLGEKHIKGIPLLLVTPEDGVRVFTESLQQEVWKIASQSLNPFQNSVIAHRTTVDKTDEASFQQKVDELLDLDESIRKLLTPEELARLAGGFGATDESVATILHDVMVQDKEQNKRNPPEEKSHKLQDVVNEGLTAAVRSGDYHTSRQLLILYSLVASHGNNDEDDSELEEKSDGEEQSTLGKPKVVQKQSSLGRDIALLQNDLEMVHRVDGTVSTGLPAPPPPPPLDTDRLRSATNSDGLLAVLGAAQVLKAMHDGSAKRRVEEVISAVEEWVDYGEQSMAFRISSWYDQRAAQGDLKINTERDTNFMAFVSNKAIANRRSFAQQLRDASAVTDFTDVRFLQAIDAILMRMHSPCLRLELLQYVLGLDNRYSVAHVRRSVELAATCLGISSAQM